MTEKARDAGYDLSDVSYQDIKEVLDPEKYDIGFEQTYFVTKELEAIDVVLPYLARRNWTLLEPTASNSFVTCDHPVILSWEDGANQGRFRPPGHGLIGTAVFFPLAPSLAIYGTFERMTPEFLKVSDGTVAQLNSEIIINANRHVFGRDTLWKFWTPNGYPEASDLSKGLRFLRGEQS